MQQNLSMATYKIRIYGRVQGVGFRYSAQREAEKHDLKGWVKNEADGSVTVEATGKKAALEAFKDWCRRGPASAHVENIKVTEEEKSSRQLDGFEVAY